MVRRCQNNVAWRSSPKPTLLAKRVEKCVALWASPEPAVNERLNPRIPARLFFGASTSLRPNVDDDLNSCRGVAVRRAIDSLVKEKDHDGLIARGRRHAGGWPIWRREAESSKDAWVGFLGMNGVGKEFVFSQIDEAFLPSLTTGTFN